MVIRELSDAPVYEMVFLNARPRGGTTTERLPFLRGRVDGLPDGLDAVVMASDLQGVTPAWDERGMVLLGVALADELAVMSAAGELPDPGAVGVILAGDLYSAPGGDKRGASGDVLEVWHAFADRFRWVAGVQGNHDRFGTAEQSFALTERPNVHLLDGGAVELDGLVVGGVGCIIGNPAKPGRRSLDDFLDALNVAIDHEPGVLVLHQGPSGDAGQRGDVDIRETIELGGVPLTVCGHSHWDAPMAAIGSGQQVLNVDARVVILTA